MPAIKLDKAKNLYVMEGSYYTRATSPLSPLFSPEYISQEEQEFYMNRGSAAHDAIGRWLKGHKDSYHKEIAGMVAAFQEWWANSGAEPVAIEMKVVSKKYLVAGQIDIVADMNKYRWVIDVKTGTASKPKKATAMQTAIYAEAYKETTGYEGHVKRMGLQCRPDGKAKAVEYTDKEDLWAYQTMLSALNVTRRYAG